MSSNYFDGRKLVDVIVSDFEKIGYNVSYKLLNSCDYGVPQRRERLIMVGIKKSLNLKFYFPVPKPISEFQKVKYVIDVPSDIKNQVDWPLSPQALSLLPIMVP